MMSLGIKACSTLHVTGLQAYIVHLDSFLPIKIKISLSEYKDTLESDSNLPKVSKSTHFNLEGHQVGLAWFILEKVTVTVPFLLQNRKEFEEDLLYDS